MRFTRPTAEIPEALVRDFVSDPLAPFDKLLTKYNDPTWPLHSELSEFLKSIPPQAIEQAYADATFVGLYGKSDTLARVWIAERLLIEESVRRRLENLAEAPAPGRIMPYAADCLINIKVDGDGMVRLADFGYNNATLATGGYSFTVCSTTESPNSTYWLLRSFYEQAVADHVSVRLDPFLWGSSELFPQTMYKMLVYATPVNWESLGKLREPAHGRMQAEPADNNRITEFCWDPRNDGVHFICEEIPARGYTGVVGGRYLHAIYDPASQSITHFDGALRIYNGQQLDERHKTHLRNAGKAGVRRKVFRIEEPISRDAFSLIAQAFFVWNRDLATYFGETLIA